MDDPAAMPKRALSIPIVALALARAAGPRVAARRGRRGAVRCGSVRCSLPCTTPRWWRSLRSCSACRQLGLAPKDLVLLALTFAVGAIALGTGRTNVLQGAVHLVIFAAFLFLSLVP